LERVRRTSSSALEFAGVVVEALAVEGVAADEVVLEDAAGPLTKVDALARLHPVAHRDDDVEVVVLDLV
jgi:hypothetical protein